MQRMGMMIGIKPDQVAAYKRLHAETWPDILAMISKCNITNYSIYLNDAENLLFGYWEYTGKDFAADGAIMAADPRTKEWWAICMPMQEPLDTRAEGEWWSMMEEVFHHD
ncbi:MAG: L-rhamnose mutarotase [Verrucomicrobia bacterium]|jgi:L-rhamnose mutarotase|nr:L-rhamnose mutarotase [Verrucomicrobiota bacterium]MBT6099478.1 L-rhamnose mutarotase [Marinovum sp.]MBT6526322.1 L-rhamnose mutarotase [Marinovum sp.]